MTNHSRTPSLAKPLPSNQSLETVQRKFSEWRALEPRPKCIPDSLWKEAVCLIGDEYSLNKVARSLSLDYKCLKLAFSRLSSENYGLVEITPAFPHVTALTPVAEIVSPQGMILRLFSGDSVTIVKTFVGL